ncbi:male sterility protein domain-containing protein [Phthorimaea operculella]|nr:male sterility protein domain-containing protein [Phthorimaea operculella]
MEVLEAKKESDVQQVYRGGTAFVTGATGFLGKHFVEKLLRSTDIEKVYLLMRPKKGKTIKERLDEMLANPLFDKLRKRNPIFIEKLSIIEGDITEINLGLSQQDRNTLSKEVCFIVHMAATVRFDETLPHATIVNVRGTREVLALAKICPKLKAFVHISTAYSHATRSRIKKEVLEQFYDVPVSPQQLIEAAENKNEVQLAKINELAMLEWPNTYTFTKAVAEELIRTQSDGLPVCIVRPSSVFNAYREPAPGWMDFSAAYGPAGVMLGVGLGVLHCMQADRDVVVDAIPADFVNNAVMAAGWATATASASFNEPKIYCAGSSTRNPTTWGICGDVHRTESRRIVTPKAVWYCYSFDIKNPILFYLAYWVLHWIPAYLIDAVCLVLGKQRQFVKLYTKGYKLFTLYSFFSTNEWFFSDRNLWTLKESLSPADQQIYNFDTSQIDWKELMLIWGIGLRKYIYQDGLKDTEYAVKKQKWLYVANLLVVAVYAYLWWKLLIFLFSAISYIFLF